MSRTGSSSQTRGSILMALVRSTLAKDILRVKLNSMHPASGRNTVKTLMSGDPEVFFAITSRLPVIINSMIGALTELAVLLKDNHPPELLRSFMASLAEDIDAEAARECGKAWAALASAVLKTSPELRASAVRILLSEGPRIKANAINALSRLVNGIDRDDPQAFGRFVSKVVEKVDSEELARAATVMAGALLDQKWHLASWTWNLVKRRVKKRLGT